MSDLSVFATQTVNTPGKAQALSGSQSGVTGAGNLAFWNALFENLLEGSATGETEDQQGNDPNAVPLADKILKLSENKDLSDQAKIDLALLQTSLSNGNANQAIEDQLSELKVERLVGFINDLTNGTPQNLSQSVNGNEGAESLLLLITSGLNPTQISEVTQRIQEVETKLGRKLTLDDLVAGVGNILPTKSNDSEDSDVSISEFLGVFLKETEVTKSLNDQEVLDASLQESLDYAQSPAKKSNTDLAQQASNKAKNKTGNIDHTGTNAGIGTIQQQIITEAQNAKNIGPSQSLSTLQNISSNTGSSGTLPTSLNQSLQSYQFGGLIDKSGIPSQGGANNLNAGNTSKIKGVQNNLQGVSQSTSATLPQVSAAALNSISLTSLGADFFNDGFFAHDGLEYNVQTGSPLNGTMLSAHATSLSTQAGQSHPATQMVATQVSKAAKGNDAGKVTIQLDPPELGRVEVRLEFHSDQNVRAHLVVEKPETYLMLQRDAHALEKALQDAGLETGSDSLNYEMAEGDYFGDRKNNNSSSGENSQTGENSINDDESLEIIETEMTWMVDSETGHVHYNIMA